MSTEPYIGEIKLFAGSFAPSGWAICAGQLLSISDNYALFNLLGTTYGGDGQQTFALPDLRGRTPIGAGQGPALSEYFLGESGGTETEALSVGQLPAHSHPLNSSPTPGDSASPAGKSLGNAYAGSPYSSSPPSAPMKAGTVGNSGNGDPHNNMPPYLSLTYIIALFGIFPSQNK